MFDLVDKALSYAEKSADYAEVRCVRSEGEQVIVRNGNLEGTETSLSQGLAIRILINGALGVAYVNQQDSDKIKSAIDSALKVAEAASKWMKTPIKFSQEKSNKANYEAKQKNKLENISTEEKIKTILDVESATKKFKISTRYFELRTDMTEKLFINSEGSKIRSLIPRMNIFYLLTGEANGNSEQRMNQIGGSGGWELWKNLNTEEQIMQDAEILPKILLNAKPVPKGEIDIVLSPEIVGIASHESVGHPYEADRILGREAAQAGESFVSKDGIGMKIGSDIVTVVDDPTIENSYGFYLFDDDGVKARRKFLIKNGVITEFLQNRQTAAIFKISSNGSARAGAWNREPIIRMSNTFMLPGDHKPEELIEGVKNGVYIKSYMEWNIDDKRFNQKYTGFEAYLIENGKLKHLVRRPVLEITTPAFWNSIDALGNKLEFSPGSCGKSDPMDACPVWFGGPSARLRKVRLGV